MAPRAGAASQEVAGGKSAPKVVSADGGSGNAAAGAAGSAARGGDTHPKSPQDVRGSPSGGERPTWQETWAQRQQQVKNATNGSATSQQQGGRPAASWGNRTFQAALMGAVTPGATRAAGPRAPLVVPPAAGASTSDATSPPGSGVSTKSPPWMVAQGRRRSGRPPSGRPPSSSGGGHAQQGGSGGQQQPLSPEKRRGPPYGQLMKDNRWMRRELHFLRTRLESVTADKDMTIARLQKDLEHLKARSAAAGKSGGSAGLLGPSPGRAAAPSSDATKALASELDKVQREAHFAAEQQAVLAQEIPALMARNSELSAALASATTDVRHLQELVGCLEEQLEQVSTERDMFLAEIARANGYRMSPADAADAGAGGGGGGGGWDTGSNFSYVPGSEYGDVPGSEYGTSIYDGGSVYQEDDGMDYVSSEEQEEEEGGEQQAGDGGGVVAEVAATEAVRTAEEQQQQATAAAAEAAPAADVSATPDKRTLGDIKTFNPFALGSGSGRKVKDVAAVFEQRASPAKSPAGQQPHAPKFHLGSPAKQ